MTARTTGLRWIAAAVAAVVLVVILLADDPFGTKPVAVDPPRLAPPVPSVVDPEPAPTRTAVATPEPVADEPQPEAPPAPTVTGRVTDLVERPVAGAEVAVYEAEDEPPADTLFDLWFRVEAWRDPLVRVTTDDEGAFVLPTLPPGAYDVVTRAEGFARDTVPIELTDELPGGAMSIRLEAGTALSGRVVSPEGRAIPNASVYLRADATGEFDAFEAWRRSDEQGRFAFHSLPDGRDWTVRARAAELVARTVRGVTLPQPAFDLILEPGEIYELRVIEAGMLEPLAARVLVRVGTDAVGAGETDGEGLFRFRAPLDETVTVHVAAADYPPRRDESRRLGSPAERLEYALAAARTVTGVVVDRSTRQGIAGADVRVDHAEHAGILPARWHETDDHGVFHVKGYDGRGLHLSAYRDGLVPGRAEETVVIDGWPTSDMTVELSTGGVVTGRVSGPRGLGLADVDLRVVTAGGVAEGDIGTRPDGSFELRSLPLNQAFRVVAWREDLGYGVSESITLANRFESPRLEIRLAGLAPLRGFVRDELGAGIPGSRVTIETIETEPLIIGITTTDRQGAFNLPGLSVPRLRVVARVAGRHAAGHFVYAEAGAFPEVTLTLPEAKSIAGTVFDASGAPAPDVELVATGGPGQPSGRGRTNVDGRFVIPGLGAGVQHVVARSAAGHRAEGDVNAGTEYATLRLGATPVADDEANR